MKQLLLGSPDISTSQIPWACFRAHLTALARTSVLGTPHFLVSTVFPTAPLLDFLTICSPSPWKVSPPLSDSFILEFLQTWFQVLSSSLPEQACHGFRFYLYTGGLWNPLSAMASSSFTSSHSLFCQTIRSLSLKYLAGVPHSSHSYLHPDVLRSECQGNLNPVHPASSNPSDPKLLEDILWLILSTSTSGPALLFLQYSEGLRLTLVSSRLVKA